MKFKTPVILGLTLALAACGHGKKHAEQGAEVVNDVAAEQMADAKAANRVVPGSEADLVKTAGDRVFFALNENKLSQAAKTGLDRQAAWLKRFPSVNVLIAGNCDDRGTQEYNLALGARRANAAADYLEAKGVAASRIKTISYGKDRPSIEGDTPEAWAQNRNAITSVR